MMSFGFIEGKFSATNLRWNIACQLCNFACFNLFRNRTWKKFAGIDGWLHDVHCIVFMRYIGKQTGNFLHFFVNFSNLYKNWKKFFLLKKFVRSFKQIQVEWKTFCMAFFPLNLFKKERIRVCSVQSGWIMQKKCSSEWNAEDNKEFKNNETSSTDWLAQIGCTAEPIKILEFIKRDREEN